MSISGLTYFFRWWNELASRAYWCLLPYIHNSGSVWVKTQTHSDMEILNSIVVTWTGLYLCFDRPVQTLGDWDLFLSGAGEVPRHDQGHEHRQRDCHDEDFRGKDAYHAGE